MTNDGERSMRSPAPRYVCPVCGRPMMSAAEGCSGGFLDVGHPPNVTPILPPLADKEQS
jgi:hypothetical protein